MRAPFESPYLPSLSGNPQGGRPGNLYHSCLGLTGDTWRQWSQNLKWGSSVHPEDFATVTASTRDPNHLWNFKVTF